MKLEGTTVDRDKLDRGLLAAHTARDSPELIRLYTLAGDMAEAEGRTDAACFYLTHALVFALEHGAPEAGSLHRRLAERGRLPDRAISFDSRLR